MIDDTTIQNAAFIISNHLYAVFLLGLYRIPPSSYVIFQGRAAKFFFLGLNSS